MAFGARMAVTVAAVITVPLVGCGGSDGSQMRATLTDDGCTYRGETTVSAGRFTIEVEDQTGHGGHFVLKELASGLTADTIKPILENPGPEITTLFKEDPVFSSDVHGDATGVLLADAPAGSYVLMCRRADRAVQGLDFAAQIKVTGTPS